MCPRARARVRAMERPDGFSRCWGKRVGLKNGEKPGWGWRLSCKARAREWVQVCTMRGLGRPEVIFFFFFLIHFIYLFIFGCVKSLLRPGFSLVAASGGYSLLQCAGVSLHWLLLLWSTGSRCAGFSNCGMRAQ